MASLVPAQLLGLTDRGRIAPGYRADLAVLDAELQPLRTIAAGETV
jgi:N-acetylglucosamine-6-phosphate deacetylase